MCVCVRVWVCALPHLIHSAMSVTLSTQLGQKLKLLHFHIGRVIISVSVYVWMVSVHASPYMPFTPAEEVVIVL